MKYRQGSHTKFKIEYHFVWATKYRYQTLQGDLALRVRELVRQTCERFEIHILRGVVSKDHVLCEAHNYVKLMPPTFFTFIIY